MIEGSGPAAALSARRTWDAAGTATSTATSATRDVVDEAHVFLRARWRRRLLHDLARVDAVLAAWDEWPDHPDRRAGVTLEAVEMLRGLLLDELQQSETH